MKTTKTFAARAKALEAKYPNHKRDKIQHDSFMDEVKALAAEQEAFKSKNNIQSPGQNTMALGGPSDPPTEADYFGVPVMSYPDLVSSQYGPREATDRLIMHRTSTNSGFNPEASRLTDQRIGAQFYIDNDGTIHMVGDPNNTMHQSLGGVNASSVGVEVQGAFTGVEDNNNPDRQSWAELTPQQKESLKQLIPVLAKQYNLKPEQIIHHGGIDGAKKMIKEGEVTAKIAREFYNEFLENEKQKIENPLAVDMPEINRDQGPTSKIPANYFDAIAPAIDTISKTPNAVSTTTAAQAVQNSGISDQSRINNVMGDYFGTTTPTVAATPQVQQTEQAPEQAPAAPQRTRDSITGRIRGNINDTRDYTLQSEAQPVQPAQPAQQEISTEELPEMYLGQLNRGPGAQTQAMLRTTEQAMNVGPRRVGPDSSIYAIADTYDQMNKATSGGEDYQRDNAEYMNNLSMMSQQGINNVLNRGATAGIQSLQGLGVNESVLPGDGMNSMNTNLQMNNQEPMSLVDKTRARVGQYLGAIGNAGQVAGQAIGSAAGSAGRFLKGAYEDSAGVRGVIGDTMGTLAPSLMAASTNIAASRSMNKPSLITPQLVKPTVTPSYFDSTEMQEAVGRQVSSAAYRMGNKGADFNTYVAGLQGVNQKGMEALGQVMTEGQKLNMAEQGRIDQIMNTTNIENTRNINQAYTDLGVRTDSYNAQKRAYQVATGQALQGGLQDLQDKALAGRGSEYLEALAMLQGARKNK